MSSSGRLRYLDAPARPVTLSGRPGQTLGTLVLLHAFPLGARMWEPQLALAQHGWHVVAPNFRGFDGASLEPARTTMDDYAGDVVDLLDTLHIHDAVICGLSMGGYVAFSLLRHAPTYIRALVLADTRPQPDTPEGKQGREKMLALLSEKGVPAVGEDLLPRLLGASSQREQPALVERVRGLIHAASSDAVGGAIHALKNRVDSVPLLEKIHVPTLILVGDEDVITPPALSEELHRAIHGSELVTIPGSGHLSSLEQPSLFNAAVTRFLDRL